MHIVDRRLNPGSKSLENRQRFLRRAKALVQGAVRKSSEGRDIKDVLEGGEVSIPLDGMNEPRFRREGGTRDIAQYFYPQGQTKVMNEGTATYVHYRIMTRLHELGRISDGNFLEFLQSHTNVVLQPDFDNPHFSGLNPYALGFAMMQDIESIVSNPDDEGREWFPDIAGTGDVMAVLRDVWANYRDESFISQFLSPRLMRHLRMFHLHDDPNERAGVKVDAIHDERGYRRVRRELARQYDVGYIDPNIEVV